MQSKGNTTAVIVLPNDTKVSFDPFSAYLSNGWEAGVAVGDTNSSAARESDWAVIYTPTDLFAGGGVPFVLEPDLKGQSSCQSPDCEPDCGESYEGGEGVGEVFIVLGETAVAAEP